MVIVNRNEYHTEGVYFIEFYRQRKVFRDPKLNLILVTTIGSTHIKKSSKYESLYN